MSPVLVFDLDDTLYLERDYVRSGFAAVARWAESDLGMHGVDEVAWRMFLAGARGTTVGDAFAELGRPLRDTELRRAIEVYRHHRPDISLCPDAVVLLRALVGNTRTGLITDGPAGSQRAKIAALGVADLIDEIIVTDEHPGWAKPAPHAYAEIESRFAAAAAECTYVADNPAKDFVTPLARGWRTVRVARRDALHTGQATPQGVDIVVDSLADSGWLDKLSAVRQAVSARAGGSTRAD